MYSSIKFIMFFVKLPADIKQTKSITPFLHIFN